MKSSAGSAEPDLPIGEVAARFDLATHVLRHWEDEGLLAPRRDAAGRRRFGEDDLVRVAAILANQSAGLSLEQIRIVFDTEAHGRHELLVHHLEDLERRLVEIQVAREVTAHALECQRHDLTTCPRFRSALRALLDGEPAPEGQHPAEWRIRGGGARRATPGDRGRV